MSTIDNLQQGAPALSEENLEYLITYAALLARAYKTDTQLTDDQNDETHRRCIAIIERYPAIGPRILEAVDKGDQFWREPADTVLKQLHDAGILVDTLGL
jgi:hypothetical protein